MEVERLGRCRRRTEAGNDRQYRIVKAEFWGGFFGRSFLDGGRDRREVRQIRQHGGGRQDGQSRRQGGDALGRAVSGKQKRSCARKREGRGTLVLPEHGTPRLLTRAPNPHVFAVKRGRLPENKKTEIRSLSIRPSTCALPRPAYLFRIVQVGGNAIAVDNRARQEKTLLSGVIYQ
jgi:hypothetical protein